jgi:NTP pyrophosphatase (non-canonical NTP hydrolase)
MTLDELCKAAHGASRKAGWWAKTHRKDFGLIPEKLLMVHSEISEAVEEYRDGHMCVWFDNGKPEGVPVEIADAIIRLADICGALGYDIEDVIQRKMAFNATRGHRHNGKII